ncbi:MAG: glycosyltransferase family 39 protein [Actinomycetota bacterium]|nr:glycosyltransferase family 39 protein [Actinomycetota bacterium]
MLLYRLAPDVQDKPLYEDEATAALIAMRPLGEVLDTVMVDRGGAPLHFLFTHAVFWVETSADALRWLSVAFALAAIPLCFDLARRLAGPGAGIVSAAVVASSTALAVYGSFGRMYALFVLVAALAADLFVRAVQSRSRGAVIAAAAAAWLLPAVHPYGAIPALVELAVAVVLWRRRSLRAAVPVALIALAALPFLVADLRLADRANVSSGGDTLASPGDAWGELVAALSAFAGGDGAPFIAFTALALLGLVVVARGEPAVAAVTATVVLPPLLFLLLSAGSAPDLSPRHLFYALPLWAAAIGVGASWLVRRLPAGLAAAAIVAIALVAVASPASGLRDPRELGLLPTRIDASVRAGRQDLLVPYSTPFLAELGQVRDGVALPQGPGDLILGALEHAGEPISTVFVAIPGDSWTVMKLEGPFDESAALFAAVEAIATTRHPPRLDWWFDLVERGLCEALAKLGRKCPT